MTLSCEASARLMIHMKCQDLILRKKKIKIIFCCCCDWRFNGSANLICRGTDISYFRESLEFQNNQSTVIERSYKLGVSSVFVQICLHITHSA